ncbi:MAG: hypothetical protein H7Y22_12235 [Gemmatimonadaceae bacterium]|nr:hypothetical protein [Gloeobacterales cyanobacterium ES-bin-141]
MTEPFSPPDPSELDFPNSKRILSGIGWGILWGGGIAVLIFPISAANTAVGLVLGLIIVTCIAAGISLYWNAAREPCPKCGTVFTATPNGGRCPNCGQRVRATERRMVVSR